MKRKISFLQLDHSDPLEQHANQKLNKLEHVLKDDEEKNLTPRFVEMWLKAQKIHPQSRVEIHLKTPRFDLHSHDEGTDMYIAIDNAVDKIVKLVKKEKERRNDKSKKGSTEKNLFESDKYSLSD